MAEITFTTKAPVRSYATKLACNRAIIRTGHDELPYIIASDEAGRFYPVFIVNENDLALTGVHFHWPVFNR